MGCPTRVQLIQRKESQQWYVNFPAAIAQAIEFQRGEVVEWFIEDKSKLVLERAATPPSRLKKNARGLSTRSTGSGTDAGAPSSGNRSGSGPSRSS